MIPFPVAVGLTLVALAIASLGWACVIGVVFTHATRMVRILRGRP